MTENSSKFYYVKSASFGKDRKFNWQENARNSLLKKIVSVR